MAKNKLPIKFLKAPSREFVEAFYGGDLGLCRCVCGREHFSSAMPEIFKKGDLGRLKEKAEGNPDAHIDHGEEMVEAIFLRDALYVVGCCCNSLLEWENLFWDRREEIADYFRIRAEKLTIEAREAAQVARKASIRGGLDDPE